MWRMSVVNSWLDLKTRALPQPLAGLPALPPLRIPSVICLLLWPEGLLWSQLLLQPLPSPDFQPITQLLSCSLSHSIGVASRTPDFLLHCSSLQEHDKCQCGGVWFHSSASLNPPSSKITRISRLKPFWFSQPSLKILKELWGFCTDTSFNWATFLFCAWCRENQCVLIVQAAASANQRAAQGSRSI